MMISEDHSVGSDDNTSSECGLKLIAIQKPQRVE
jgi:hypothetical protein